MVAILSRPQCVKTQAAENSTGNGRQATCPVMLTVYRYNSSVWPPRGHHWYNTALSAYHNTYSTSLGCRRQPSLACHAWNHGKSPKSSPLSQQCRFHCHTWSAGESHYCVNSKGFMKFGTHTNEESDEYQKKWLPLSDFVGLCSKYIAIPYGSGFHFEKPIVPNNPMFLISPVQPWWCQYMTISTLLDICVLTGFPRKGFVMRNLDVYLNVRRKKC